MESTEGTTKFITSHRVPYPHDCPALLSEMCVSIHCDKISEKKNLEEEDFLWPVFQRPLSMVNYCFWAYYKAEHYGARAWWRQPAVVV